MIYKNKTQSQNLSIYKQRDPSLLAIFSDYDKHTLKKKAGFYFRISKKEKKRKERYTNKKAYPKDEVFLDLKLKASNKAFIKRKVDKKNFAFECKFYEDQVSYTSRSHRLVGYSYHGDLFARHI